MTPKTTTQNLAYWGAALGIALLLSFVSGVMTHWAPDGPIDWRGVWLDVGQTVLTVVPIVAAGFGLPRLGKEVPASLISRVGTERATAALEVEATRQIAAAPADAIHPDMTPEQNKTLVRMVRVLGPEQSIVALADRVHAHREGAP